MPITFEQLAAERFALRQQRGAETPSAEGRVVQGGRKPDGSTLIYNNASIDEANASFEQIAAERAAEREKGIRQSNREIWNAAVSRTENSAPSQGRRIPTAAGGFVDLDPEQARKYGQELQATPVDPNASHRQVELAERGETFGGRLQNAGAAFAGNLANTGLDALGTVMPKTAENLAVATNAQYATDPSSPSSMAGSASAEILKLLALRKAGPAGFASIYGPLGVGSTRRKAEQTRAAGQNVSGLSEAATSLGVGAVQAGSGYLAGTLFEKIGELAKKGVPAALKLMGVLASEGGQEGAEQLLTNVLVKQGIDPNQQISEGVVESTIMGSLLAPFGGLGRGGSQTESDQVVSPAQPTPAAPPGSPAASPAVTQAETSAQPAEAALEIPRRYQVSPDLTAAYERGARGEELGATKSKIEDQAYLEGATAHGSKGRSSLESELTAVEQGEKALETIRPQKSAFTPAPAESNQITDSIKSALAPVEKANGTPRTFAAEDIAQYINLHSTDADMGGARQLLGDKLYTMQDVPVESLKTRGSTELKQAQIQEYAKKPGEDAPAIVADESGQIIDGNRRLEAAKLRGDKTIKAFVPVDSGAKKSAFTPAKPAPDMSAPPKRVKALAPVEPPKTPAPTETPPPAPPSEPDVSFGDEDEGPRSVFTKSHERSVPSIVERIITPTLSRIQDIAPAVSRRVRDMYLASGIKSAGWKNDVREGLQGIEAFRDANPDTKQDVNDALFNSDIDGIKHVLPESLHAGIDVYFEARSQAFDQQKEAGVKIGDIGHKMPRRVIDPKGLKEALGSEAGIFDEAIKVRTQAKGSPLTVDETAEIMSDVINGYGPRAPGSIGPGHARVRSLDTVLPELQKFYADPLEAAMGYFDAAAKATERAKFLGRGDSPELLNDSIGKVIATTSPDLAPDKQNELHGLLQTLFIADTKHASKAVQKIRRAIYATSLTHMWSGISQLTDAAMQAARYDIKSAVGGMRDALRLTPEDGRYILHDMGLDHPPQEFRDTGKMGKIAEGGLVANLFQRIDVLTKESGMNTARRYMTDAANNPNGLAYAKVKRDWEPVYGPKDFADAMAALKRGDIQNENARSLAFAHLTEMQPVTMANMPENYLKMADGRLMYTLHTFQLQQFDMLRRDIARKLKTPGQRQDGLKNLSRVILLAGLANLGKDFIKDLMQGRPTHKSFGERGFDSILGIVGLNRYVATEFKQHPVKTMLDMALPPMSQFDAPVHDATTIGDGKGLESFKLIPVPYINDLMYYWTPWGAGYHKKEADAKKDYNKKLDQLHDDAYKARKSGDRQQARTLMNLYNGLQKENFSKSRRKLLEFDDLSAPPSRSDEGKEAAEIRKAGK